MNQLYSPKIIKNNREVSRTLLTTFTFILLFMIIEKDGYVKKYIYNICIYLVKFRHSLFIYYQLEPKKAKSNKSSSLMAWKINYIEKKNEDIFSLNLHMKKKEEKNFIIHLFSIDNNSASFLEIDCFA